MSKGDKIAKQARTESIEILIDILRWAERIVILAKIEELENFGGGAFIESRLKELRQDLKDKNG